MVVGRHSSFIAELATTADDDGHNSTEEETDDAIDNEDTLE